MINYGLSFLIKMSNETGLPPSGKIRENFVLLESQGISVFFVESQGKSRKMIWLR